jgi:hypothetical protein
MSVVVILPGDEVSKDPNDIKVYCFDWDANSLAPTVAINTSTFTITAIYPSTTDVALTIDSTALLTAAQATSALQRTVTLDSRVTRFRLTAGTPGQIYEVANKIVTTESPAQTKERSFRIVVENQ